MNLWDAEKTGATSALLVSHGGGITWWYEDGLHQQLGGRGGCARMQDRSDHPSLDIRVTWPPSKQQTTEDEEEGSAGTGKVVKRAECQSTESRSHFEPITLSHEMHSKGH